MPQQRLRRSTAQARIGRCGRRSHRGEGENSDRRNHRRAGGSSHLHSSVRTIDQTIPYGTVAAVTMTVRIDSRSGTQKAASCRDSPVEPFSPGSPQEPVRCFSVAERSRTGRTSPAPCCSTPHDSNPSSTACPSCRVWTRRPTGSTPSARCTASTATFRPVPLSPTATTPTADRLSWRTAGRRRRSSTATASTRIPSPSTSTPRCTV